MRLAESFSDFQFFTNRYSSPRSNDFQFDQSARCSSFDRDEFLYQTKVNTTYLFLAIPDFPSEKIICFLVIIIQYLGKYFFILGMAECIRKTEYPIA